MELLARVNRDHVDNASELFQIHSILRCQQQATCQARGSFFVRFLRIRNVNLDVLPQSIELTESLFCVETEVCRMFAVSTPFPNLLLQGSHKKHHKKSLYIHYTCCSPAYKLIEKETCRLAILQMELMKALTITLQLKVINISSQYCSPFMVLFGRFSHVTNLSLP